MFFLALLLNTSYCFTTCEAKATIHHMPGNTFIALVMDTGSVTCIGLLPLRTSFPPIGMLEGECSLDQQTARVQTRHISSSQHGLAQQWIAYGALSR